MAKKISGKNLAILIPTSLMLGASVGVSVSYIWQWPFLWSFALVNGIGHTPLFLAVSDAIRQEMGLRSPAQIAGNWGSRPGRKIPINANGKSKDIFMLLMPGQSSEQSGKIKDIPELKTISIFMDNENHKMPLFKIEDFLYSAWRKQRQGGYGLSRRYWTRERHPRLSVLDYKLIMEILRNVSGLVINRGERKSGYLSVSPKMALELIKENFGE